MSRVTDEIVVLLKIGGILAAIGVAYVVYTKVKAGAGFITSIPDAISEVANNAAQKAKEFIFVPKTVAEVTAAQKALNDPNIPTPAGDSAAETLVEQMALADNTPIDSYIRAENAKLLRQQNAAKSS